MDDELDELEDRLRAVEYDHWRRNAPFLYDLELIRTLVWPSLTVQWLPGKEQDDESNFSIQQVLIGTHTSGAAQNYLTIAEVAIPVDELSEGSGGEGSGGGYVNTYQQLADKFTDALKIPHEGEINKARYMPQSSPGAFVVATKPPFPEVCVFKTDRYPTAAQLAEGAEPVEEGECNPDLRLTGHVSEGYGLAWSHLREGHLLSGSDDGSVCTWDINATPWDGRDVPALSTYLGHTEVVEDVAWHYFNPHIFGSVGDDKQLILRDTRKPADQAALKVVEAHSQEVNGLDWSPHSPHLLATASSDTAVALRDWRQLAQPLHVLEAHTQGVFQVSWSPQHPTVLASSGLDRRLLVWDISRIGASQAQEDAADGPPELLFVHAGQSSKLNEFSWNPTDDWVVASVSEENTLQVWQVTESIRESAGQVASPA